MSSLIQPGIFAIVFITQLGSPSYQKREHASRSLGKIAPLVVPYLESAKEHPDLEVARRSNLILASYYEQAAEELTKNTRPTEWPHLPWMDMLPRDYPDRSATVELFLAQARDRIGRKGPPHWEDHRLATELFLHHLYRNQNKREAVIELLDTMADREQQWIKDNGKNYTPPLKLPVVRGK